MPRCFFPLHAVLLVITDDTACTHECKSFAAISLIVILRRALQSFGSVALGSSMSIPPFQFSGSWTLHIFNNSGWSFGANVSTAAAYSSAVIPSSPCAFQGLAREMIALSCSMAWTY